MRGPIFYVPEGITIDLGEDDYGHPRGAEIVAATLGRCSRANPVLLCVRDGGSPMYLQRHETRLGSRQYLIWSHHFDGHPT